MKYQVVYSLKNVEKIFKDVVCCSRDWRLQGNNKRFVLMLLCRKHENKPVKRKKK